MTAARAAAAAQAVARRRRPAATAFLQTLVRVPSLTGEEGPGQLALARRVESLGLAVDLEEPRLERLFAAYPDVAQYPTQFACDLRHLVNQGSMPGIVFGPGSIAEAHRPDDAWRSASTTTPSSG